MLGAVCGKKQTLERGEKVAEVAPEIVLLHGVHCEAVVLLAPEALDGVHAALVQDVVDGVVKEIYATEGMQVGTGAAIMFIG